MRAEPTNKVLPFKLRDPTLQRYACPCGSTTFTLWTDGQVHCTSCRSHHHTIKFTVDETHEPEVA